jgi:hypothetical protein
MTVSEIVLAKAKLVVNYKKSILDRALENGSTSPTNLEKARFDYEMAKLDVELAEHDPTGIWTKQKIDA